jgi:hypothetical protein
MAFQTEIDLFKTALSSTYIKRLIMHQSFQSCFLVEPKGLFGIPDLVIANLKDSSETDYLMETYAFEMKLSNWKRALAQAFRYKSFANFSFVMIDYDKSSAALSNLDKFKKANIGLLSIDASGSIITHYHPNFDLPYSNRLADNLENIVLRETRFI